MLAPESVRVGSRLTNVESLLGNENKVFSSRNRRVLHGKHIEESSSNPHRPIMYLNRNPSSILSVRMNGLYDPERTDDPSAELFLKKLRLRRMYFDPIPWEYYLHDEDEHDYLTDSLPQSLRESNAISPKFAIKTSLSEPFGRVNIQDAGTQTIIQTNSVVVETEGEKPKEVEVRDESIATVHQDSIPHSMESSPPNRRTKQIESSPKSAESKRKVIIEDHSHAKTNQPTKPLTSSQIMAPHSRVKVPHIDGRDNQTRDIPRSVPTFKRKAAQQRTKIIETIQEQPSQQRRKLVMKPPLPKQARGKPRRASKPNHNVPIEKISRVDDRDSRHDILEDLSFIDCIDRSISQAERGREVSGESISDYTTSNNVSHRNSEDTTTSGNYSSTSSRNDDISSSDNSHNYNADKERYQDLERRFRESMLRIEQSKRRSEWIDKYIHLLDPPGEPIGQTLDAIFKADGAPSISERSYVGDHKSDSPSKSSVFSSSSLSTSIATSKLLGESQVFLEENTSARSDTSALSSNSSYDIISDDEGMLSENTVLQESVETIENSSMHTTPEQTEISISGNVDSSSVSDDGTSSSLSTNDSASLEELERVLELQHEKLVRNGFIIPPNS